MTIHLMKGHKDFAHMTTTGNFEGHPISEFSAEATEEGLS